MAENTRSLVGHNLIGANGEKIGKIGNLYVDVTTGEPEWLVIKAGMLGGDRFVPMTEVTVKDGDAVVAFDKGKVKGAPHSMGEGALSPTQEKSLYRYYGVDRPEDEISGSEDVGLWNARH